MSMAVLILVFTNFSNASGAAAVQIDMPSIHACDREAERAIATQQVRAAYCVNRSPERAR